MNIYIKSNSILFLKNHIKTTVNCFNLYWPFIACYTHVKEHQDPPMDG